MPCFQREQSSLSLELSHFVYRFSVPVRSTGNIIFLIFIYLFAGSSLHCVTQALSLRLTGLSSCGAQAPECVGLVTVVHGLSCSAECGILVP